MSKKKLTEDVLKRYAQRIRATFSPEELKSVFDGAYISSFSVYTTTELDREMNHPACNECFVLMKICRSLGIRVKGVTSERTIKGKKISDVDRDVHKVVYVGKYSYFTKHKSSPFRLLPSDYKVAAK